MTMPQSNYRFERIEKKFWMSTFQYEALLPVLERHLIRDDYGETVICNIYYDKPDFTLIRESIERPYFKEKLRLRSYGFPEENDLVYVELKRKLDGIGYKRRIRIPYAGAKAFLSGDLTEEELGKLVKTAGADPQIAAEIGEFVKRYQPQPVVCLTYRRYAMYGQDDRNFRVTIDRDLRYRKETEQVPGAQEPEPMMPDDTLVLMEIKAEGAIPRWLVNELDRLKIYQAPFSKVGYCYLRHIAPNLRYDAFAGPTDSHS